MFLRQTTLNALMKQAYKSGLIVGKTKDDWIYVAGSYWEASIKKEFIPKKTMGDIITLIGELPKPGERMRATKEGNELETEGRLRVDEKSFGERNALTVTNVLMVGTEGIVQRLMQDEMTGTIYAVNNVFVNIVDNGQIDSDRGEYRVEAPYFDQASGILWENNVCKLRACFRQDEKTGRCWKR